MSVHHIIVLRSNAEFILITLQCQFEGPRGYRHKIGLVIIVAFVMNGFYYSFNVVPAYTVVYG